RDERALRRRLPLALHDHLLRYRGPAPNIGILHDVADAEIDRGRQRARLRRGGWGMRGGEGGEAAQQNEEQKAHRRSHPETGILRRRRRKPFPPPTRARRRPRSPPPRPGWPA